MISSAMFQRLISRIDTVSSTEELKMIRGIAGIAKSADRISGFHLKLAYRIAIYKCNNNNNYYYYCITHLTTSFVEAAP